MSPKGVPLQEGDSHSRYLKNGQEAYTEGTSNGDVDIRGHLEVDESEDGTETDTHGGPARTQDGNEAVPNRTEGGQEMQGEESRGGY